MHLQLRYRPKSGVGMVGRGVGSVELNYNYNPAASRRIPAATAAEGGVMQLQLRYRPKRGGWCGWLWSGACGVEVEVLVAVAVLCQGLQLQLQLQSSFGVTWFLALAN
jgi:hypothetical protein